MILRDYQRDCVESVWNNMCEGNQTSLVILPCGSGKSIIFQELIRKSIEAKPDIQVCVLFNRVNLLEQQETRMRQSFGDIVGIWCGSLNRHDEEQILMSSVQSIYDEDHEFNLIIIDEVHNTDDKRGKYFEFIEKKIAKNPRLKIIGFTATPYRYDGMIYGKDRLFKNITYKKDLNYFIDNNYLVPPISKEPDHVFDTSKLRTVAGDYSQSDIDNLVNNEAFVRAQVADALTRIGERKKVAWFCSNINHAEMVRTALVSYGEESVTIHSKLSDSESDNALFCFESTGCRHITFITMLSEGYDYPPIDCIILMRPTKSAALYVQTVGRGLRPSEGKSDCLILDYANVVSNLGTINEPVTEKRSKVDSEKPVIKVCKVCRTQNKLKETHCIACMTEFIAEVKVEKMTLVPDEVTLIGGKMLRKMEPKDVKFYDYKSKNGNNCRVIEYIPSGFDFMYKSNAIKEYFVENNMWAMNRYEFRIAQFDFANKNNQDLKEVWFEMDGKYPKIKQLVFVEAK